MSAKGLIVTRKTSYRVYEIMRLEEECRRRGVGLEVVYYEDFGIRLAGNKVKFEYKKNEIELDDYDFAFFRPAIISEKINLKDLKKMLIEEMVKLGVRVVNGKSFIEHLTLGKLEQQKIFGENEIAFVESWYGLGEFERLKESDYPVVIKVLHGSQGIGVYLAKNKEDVDKIVGRHGAHRLMIQRFLPGARDYRVLVVGGEAVGVMERSAGDTGFLTNISAGGSGRGVELSDDLKKIAERVAEVFGLDYCGVDIMYDEHGLGRVLEVNRHAKYVGFEKNTQINVTGKLVDFFVAE